jgi:peptidyl-prolyl cis-trans isomerase D
MMIDKLRVALTDWMAVSDADLEREYRKRNEKVKLQVVALMADRFRDKVTVNDADVAAYFEAHKANYRIGEQRKIKYLLLDRDQVRAKAVVTPTDIQRFYNENLQNYESPEQIRASHILLKTEDKDEATVRKQAEEVLKQAKSGADFAELAKKFSEDEGSKANGGDLDYFGRGRMVPEFENAAFAMEPGQISDLLKTQYGFHIIKLVDKKPMTTRSLDEVRGQIQEQLQTQKTERQLADRAAQLQSEIDDPSDLDRVGKESGLTVQESGFFAGGDPIPGLGPAPQIATTAFRLKDNEVSTPLNSPRGPVFFTVTGKKDPYVPKLEEVKDKVREDVVRARATELATQRAGAIVPALRSSKDFVAAAKAQGFEAKETDLIARNSPLPDIGARPAIDKVAFALPAGAVSEPIALNDGTAIVRVAERDEVTSQEWSQDKDSFRAQLLNERRSLFFSAYMTRAKQRMKIDVRNDVVRRVVDPASAGV